MISFGKQTNKHIFQQQEQKTNDDDGNESKSNVCVCVCVSKLIFIQTTNVGCECDAVK